MTDRIVRHIRKSLYGDIIALFNPEENWSPRQKDDAIQDIVNGEYTYHIQWGKMMIEISVAEGLNGKYLRSDHESPARNSLVQKKIKVWK